MHLLLAHIQAEPPRPMPHSHIVACALQTLRPHAKLGANLLHQLVVRAGVHGLTALLAEPRLRVHEQPQMLAGGVGRMRLVDVGVVEELVQRRLVQRHGRQVVPRRRVQAGQQLGHLQRDGVAVAPDLSEVVANIPAELRCRVGVPAAETGFHQTPADPDDHVGRPCFLDETRGPEVGEDGLVQLAYACNLGGRRGKDHIPRDRQTSHVHPRRWPDRSVQRMEVRRTQSLDGELCP